MSTFYLNFFKDMLHLIKDIDDITKGIGRRRFKMFSYAPLMATLHRHKLSKTDLQKMINVSSATIAKISKDEFISMKVLEDICTKLNCEIEDVITHIKEEDHQS